MLRENNPCLTPSKCCEVRQAKNLKFGPSITMFLPYPLQSDWVSSKKFFNFLRNRISNLKLGTTSSNRQSVIEKSSIKPIRSELILQDEHWRVIDYSHTQCYVASSPCLRSVLFVVVQAGWSSVCCCWMNIWSCQNPWLNVFTNLHKFSIIQVFLLCHHEFVRKYLSRIKVMHFEIDIIFILTVVVASSFSISI